MNPEVLFKLNYGVYIVSSSKGDRINGQIANVVFQVTNEPLTIGIAINRNNLTHEYIIESGVFAISILEKDTPLKLIGQFGFKCGRDTDKFSNVGYKKEVTACPIITDHSLGYIEAKLINKLDVMTHTIFVGEVVGGDILKEGEPMTYDYYHKVKRGTTHKNAPTYVKNKKEE